MSETKSTHSESGGVELPGDHKLRLLCFDNGVYRGLSMLAMLEEIMKRIQKTQGLEEEPKPADYFDLIGGSGTGGLIAILLGRLRLTVPDAIEKYQRLSRKVYGNRPGALFDETKLEKEFREIVEESLQQHNPKFIDAKGTGCKTFVCTSEASAPEVTRLFRTYGEENFKDANISIVDAARATTAMPGLFNELQILQESFIGSPKESHHPVKELVLEAERIYGDVDYACILSIGCDHGFGKLRSPSSLLTVPKFGKSRVIEIGEAVPIDITHSGSDLKRCVFPDYKDETLPSNFYRLNMNLTAWPDWPDADWEPLRSARERVEAYMKTEATADRYVPIQHYDDQGFGWKDAHGWQGILKPWQDISKPWQGIPKHGPTQNPWYPHVAKEHIESICAEVDHLIQILLKPNLPSRHTFTELHHILLPQPQPYNLHCLHHMPSTPAPEPFHHRQDVSAKMWPTLPHPYTASNKRLLLHTRVLLGPANSGKTVWAQSFCERMQTTTSAAGDSAKKSGVQGVFWVDASSKAAALASFCSVGEALVLEQKRAHTETAGKGGSEQAEELRRYQLLQQLTSADELVQLVLHTFIGWRKPWVMIFDGYTPGEDFSLDEIRAMIPKGMAGTVIVTTRAEEVRELGYTVDIDNPSATPAIELDEAQLATVEPPRNPTRNYTSRTMQTLEAWPTVAVASS